MNSVILSKNKYTSVAFGTTDKHSETQYRLFTNRVKLKQKKYVNALVTFINVFNTFVTEKFPDEKDLWLIINNNQTTNYDLLDATDKIYNITEELDKIEKRLDALENTSGVTGYRPKSFVGMFTAGNKQSYIDGYVSVNNVNPNVIAMSADNLTFVHLPKNIEFTFETFSFLSLSPVRSYFKWSLIR